MTGSDTKEGSASPGIINKGIIDFQYVKVSFTGQDVQYGELVASHISGYKFFEKACYNGFIETEDEEKTYRLAPYHTIVHLTVY